MRLTLARKAYLRAYYAEHTDADLAKVLGVTSSEIRAAAKRLHLTRTAADIDRMRQRVKTAAPVFDGQWPRPAWYGPLTWRDFLVAGIAALLVFFVYLATLPPSITGEDSGELVAAAYSLGIPHPPGYPLWCLASHPFTYLPLGTVAFRVALSSAVYGSLAVGVLTLVCCYLTRNRLAALIAGIAAGVSQQMWMQSVIAEVYGLNALLFALCLLFLVRWYGGRNVRDLYLLSAAYGLSLTNHHTMMLIAPVLLAALLWIDPVPWLRWRRYATGLGIALSMLLVYLYLPIRAAINPPVNWGDPSNFANFWDVVTRKQYAFAFTQEARSPSRFAEQSWVFLQEYAAQWGIWLAWLPLLGLWRLAQRDRIVAGITAFLFAATVLGIIIGTNFNTDRQSVWLNSVFCIPAYLVAAVWIGAALAWLFGRLPIKPWAVPVQLLAGVVAVGLPLTLNHARADKSDYYFALDYGRNVMATLEPDALYIPSADHATFPALYLQAVEGQRPDVTIADVYGYIKPELYADMPVEMRSRFRKIPTEAESRVIEQWLIEHTTRPVYFTKKRPTSDLPGHRVVAAGLLYRLVRPDESYSPQDHWDKYTWHTLDADDARGEFSAGLILADHHFARGREWLEQGEVSMGLAAFDLALEAQGEDKETLNNFGSAAAEAAAFDAARQYFEQSVALDPEYELGLKNLAKVCMQLNDYQAVRDTVAKINGAGQLDFEMILLDAQALRRLGEFTEARDMLDQLAELMPDDPRVFRELGLLYADDLKDPLLARRYLSRAIALDPSQVDLIGRVSSEGAQVGAGPLLPGVQAPVQMPHLPTPGAENSLPTSVPGLPRMPSPATALPPTASAPPKRSL